MNTWCFLDTRFSAIIFAKGLSRVFVLKHVAEPFKCLPELFKYSTEPLKTKEKIKSSVERFCYNAAYDAPVFDGKIYCTESNNWIQWKIW